MTPTREGSFRLFRLGGIDVFLHWTWLLVVFYFIETRAKDYSAPVWAVWECLALFAIVLMHEFGHSLATKQVGGTSDTIVLWPFGGVAYVNAPPRPGAHLWSIVAGPLVNVVLFPILLVVQLFVARQGASESVETLASAVFGINVMLLVFNLLPIYPLDGGQILRTLLWFMVGPVKSLLWAAAIGFLGCAALGLYAWEKESLWLGFLVFMIFMSCRNAWVRARELQASGVGD